MPRRARSQLRFGFADVAPPNPVSIHPVGRAPPPSSRTRLALGTRSVIVSFERHADGATVRLLALEDDAAGASSLSLDVRLRPILSATIQSDSPRRLHWGMVPHVTIRPREFFGYALGWTARKLAGDTVDPRRLAPVREATRPVLLDVATRIASTIDPEIVRTCRRFDPRTRTRVASALARDPRGWLVQAARAHPGLVLFGLALEDVEETEDAGIALLHDLSEGRRLGPALDGAVEAWARALPAWSAPSDLRPRALRGAFAAAAEAVRGEARARILGAKKVLVRRAGPWCEPDVLLVPPPLRSAPEDVPGDPLANERWFRVMTVPGVTVEGRPAPLDPALAEAFSSFASRHAEALLHPPRGIELATWLRELVGVFRASGRVPSRAADPARIVAQVDVEELRRRLAEPQPRLFALPGEEPAAPAAPVAAEPVAPAPGAAPAPGGGDRPALPARYDRRSRTISPRAFEPWSSDRATVVQIETLLELREEGERMHNCVASYKPLVEDGQFVVFSAQVDGNPITIAVQPCMSGWRLHEWKGFANRRLTRPEVEALRPWLLENRIADAWRAQ